MSKIKVFILDDHQMLIDGLKALLMNEKQFEIIGIANTAKDALEQIGKNTPDVVLSDINMPEMDGIAFTRELKKNHPQVKVLALSMFGEKSTISEILDAGASGYILKNTGKEELINALLKISSGGMFFSDEISAEMMKAMSERGQKEEKVHLTEREKEIINLIAKEYSNAQIGEALFISERTVETHRKNIFRKANTKTVVGLMKFAMENKLISD
ncbi:MAG: two component transcriptional regulator, LuxR family [Bacteroidetes bacterium]|jgi:two-component system nitrate/nitrite response regulator NarL|nr:two component transcriptional regulator, LuxR family [Bacteroidota bacterium]